jgi:hypothetical protein
MHAVRIVLVSWLAAQPVFCAGWAFALRHRRAEGGN